MNTSPISTLATPVAWCEDCDVLIFGGPAAVVDHHSRLHCTPETRMREYRARKAARA